MAARVRAARGRRRPGLRLPALLLTLVAAAGLLVAVPVGRAVAAAPNTTAWTRQSPSSTPTTRSRAASAFDTATGQLVLFGGVDGSGNDLGDTWTWTGSNWVKQSPSSAPSARHGASLAYDDATGQLLLFGGIAGGSAVNDTWTWTGATWSQLSPSNPPPVRGGAALAFSPAGRQLVLFGGSDGSAVLGDTWLWSGTTWTQSTGSGPSARVDATAATDAGSGSVVLFGGASNTDDTGSLGDTWLWTGSAWSSTSPATSPSQRYGATAAFDQRAGRVVLLGGARRSTLQTGVWSWTGSTWVASTQSSANQPDARRSATMVYNPATARLLLFGGADGSGTALSDTWTSAASPATPTGFGRGPTTGPPGLAGASMDFDEATGQVILFGGRITGNAASADTWLWSGSGWTKLSPSTSPGARYAASMAYDPATGQLLLFGGYSGSALLNDVWSWTGSTWTQITVSGTVPSARYAAALRWSPGAQQMVLFGGASGSGYLQDVWTWSGSAWTQVTTADPQPSARYGAAFAWDPATAQMLLFGGQNSARQNDTWTWSGTAWTRVATGGPSARTYSAMAFVPSTGELLLYGGDSGASSSLNDVWTWGGSSWTQRSSAALPTQGRAASAAAYNPATGRLVLVGGNANSSASSALAETWIWDYQPQGLSGASASLGATLSGYDQSFQTAQQVQVDMPSGGGWNVTMAVDQAPRSGSTSLAAPAGQVLTVNGSSSAATDSTAPAASCSTDGCTAPSTGGTVPYPVALTPGAASALVYSAGSGSGTGRASLDLHLWERVRADSRAGTYASTVTVTVNYGP